MTPHRTWPLLLCVVFLVALSFHPPSALSAEQTPAQKLQAELTAEKAHSQQLLEAIRTLSAQSGSQSQYPPEVREQLTRAEADLGLAYIDVQRAQYDHFMKLQSFDEGVFAWQQRASSWVLYLVAFVTVSGVVFAGAQLFVSLRALWYAKQAAPADTGSITLSPTQVSITSAGIGVIVLTLSIAFLYLFLKEVYTIKPLQQTAQSQPAANPAPAPAPTPAPTPK